MASRENLTIQEKLRRLTAASCIALGALGLAGCASNANAAPNSDKVPVVPADSLSGESDPNQNQISNPIDQYLETISTGEELRDKYRIPAGLNDEELGHTLLNRLDNWTMYGTNPGLPEAIDIEIERAYTEDGEGNTDIAVKKALTKIAQTGADTIVPSIFAPEYINGLKPFIDNMTENNVREMNFYEIIQSHINSGEEAESYSRWRELQGTESISVLSLPTDARGLRVYYTEYGNTDKNRADDLGAIVGPEGIRNIAEFGLIEIDGHEYIATLNIIPDNSTR